MIFQVIYLSFIHRINSINEDYVQCLAINIVTPTDNGNFKHEQINYCAYNNNKVIVRRNIGYSQIKWVATVAKVNQNWLEIDKTIVINLIKKTRLDTLFNPHFCHSIFLAHCVCFLLFVCSSYNLNVSTNRRWPNVSITVHFHPSKKKYKQLIQVVDY